MATVPTQIRIDREIKAWAMALFASLGLDMSSAVNLFLRQCVLRGGIPFPIEMQKIKQKKCQLRKKMTTKCETVNKHLLPRYAVEF